MKDHFHRIFVKIILFGTRGKGKEYKAQENEYLDIVYNDYTRTVTYDHHLSYKIENMEKHHLLIFKMT